MPGYSGTPLSTKLGIKPGSEIHVVRAPDDYLKLVDPLPEGVKFVPRVSKNTDLVHMFTVSKTELAKALHSYRAKLKPAAVIWISWPKKSAKVETDITED